MLANFLDPPPRDTAPLGRNGDPSLREAINAMFRRAVTRVTLDGEAVGLVRDLQPLPRGMQIFNNPAFLDWLEAEVERGLVHVYADEEEDIEVWCDGTEGQRPNLMEHIPPDVTPGRFVAIVQRNLARWGRELEGLDEDDYEVHGPAPGHRRIEQVEAVRDDIGKLVEDEESSSGESSVSSEPESSSGESSVSSEPESSTPQSSEPGSEPGSDPSDPGSSSSSSSSSEPDAPCECPCSKEEWPPLCNGLVDEYEIVGGPITTSGTGTSCQNTVDAGTCFGSETDWNKRFAATATSCRWEPTQSVKTYYCWGGRRTYIESSGGNSAITLDDSNCEWVLGFTMDLPWPSTRVLSIYEKATGKTPAGTYTAVCAATVPQTLEVVEVA